MFVKLNQINICLTEDEEKTNKPLYIACEVKHLRIDEFRSLKFGTIKPKLFENESPGINYSFQNVCFLRILFYRSI